MINITLKESNRKVDFSKNIKAPIEINQQLDMSLDSGTLSYLVTEPDDKGLNEALAGYSISAGNTSFDFVGVDSRALVTRKHGGQSLYSHQVSLTEPSKLLQGVMIDGFGVTQPEVITYKDVTKIVSQDSLIHSMANLNRYKHWASGRIAICENCKEIVSIEGSIAATTPKVFYDNQSGDLVWDVMWFDSESSYSHTFTVTITYTYSFPQANTLENVVERLLKVMPFDGQRFKLTKADVAVRRALHKVIAPEFKWNTQTTLWECLLQVGAVIDAMPRLVADNEGNYTVITFDFVNASVGEVNWIDDSLTNALGEDVDERQYNTALSAIVENLRENE